MRRDLAQFEGRVFDILVVGGGVQGAWMALRAAQHGLSVALIERADFGGATSSNSLNILHGGLRYLQHFDLLRMRSSIRARREFCRVSPRLVRPLQCLMPLRAVGVRSPWTLGPALLLNDLISADRNQGVEDELRLPYGRLLGGRRCRELVAPLAETEAYGGAIWWDAVTLDPARLTLDAVIAAADAGAVVANHLEASEYLVHGETVVGVAARDRLSPREFEIRARVVVNAAGPWALELSHRSALATPFAPPGWVGGLNLVLRRPLGIGTAVALSAASKAADRSALLQRATRELFFVPWRGGTAVGTDYCAVGEPREGVTVSESVVGGFVDEVARVAPRAAITLDDVAAVQWGLLPQDDSGAVLPRKAPIVAAGAAGAGARGLVVLIGEKLTSAPMLSRAVLRKVLKELAVVGGAPAVNVSVAPAAATSQRPPAAEGRALTAAEVVHSIREEMAMSLEDLVLRRLGLGYMGHPGSGVLRLCAELAAPEFGWNAEDMEREVSGMADRLSRYSLGAVAARSWST